MGKIYVQSIQPKYKIVSQLLHRRSTFHFPIFVQLLLSFLHSNYLLSLQILLVRLSNDHYTPLVATYGKRIILWSYMAFLHILKIAKSIYTRHSYHHVFRACMKPRSIKYRRSADQHFSDHKPKYKCQLSQYTFTSHK